MSVDTWKAHLESRGNPALEDLWGDTQWKFYEYPEEVPNVLPVLTSMCVPVCSLDTHNPQTMLTLNLGRGGYEIPGGHLDPLQDAVEPSSQAAVRETQEETGLRLDPALLIPFGYIEARNQTAGSYPRLSYMQFFSVHATENPGLITDPEVDGAGIFTVDALRTMANRGAMRVTELSLVCFGIRALLRSHGLSDEHIRMP